MLGAAEHLVGRMPNSTWFWGQTPFSDTDVHIINLWQVTGTLCFLPVNLISMFCLAGIPQMHARGWFHWIPTWPTFSDIIRTGFPRLLHILAGVVYWAVFCRIWWCRKAVGLALQQVVGTLLWMALNWYTTRPEPVDILIEQLDDKEQLLPGSKLCAQQRSRLHIRFAFAYFASQI